MEIAQAERDSNNEPIVSVVPPVKPSHQVEIPPRELAEESLNPRREKLSRFWGLEQIEAVGEWT